MTDAGDGYHEEGRDEDGYDRDGYDSGGFDQFLVHRNGTPYDDEGWDVHEFHRDTGTPYDPEGYMLNGYDRDGKRRPEVSPS